MMHLMLTLCAKQTSAVQQLGPQVVSLTCAGLRKLNDLSFLYSTPNLTHLDISDVSGLSGRALLEVPFMFLFSSSARLLLIYLLPLHCFSFPQICSFFFNIYSPTDCHSVGIGYAHPAFVPSLRYDYRDARPGHRLPAVASP